MNKTYLFLIIAIGVIVSSLNTVSAQNQTDSIFFENNRIYKQNDVILGPKQLLEVTKINPEAYKEMKIAKSNSDFAMILSAGGGFMIGWTLGTALGGGEPQWALAGVGVGLLVLTIPLMSGYKKHAKNAVDIYNSGLNKPPTTVNRKVKLDMGLTSNGFGLVMTF